MDPVASESPSSIRLDSTIKEMVDRHIALRSVLGDKVNLSDVVREALAAYLPPFEAELKRQAIETLSE